MHDELMRLETLYSYQILDTPPEEGFDEIVRMAAQLCETPVAAIGLVDSTRQWFKARLGLANDVLDRAVTPCEVAVEQKQALLINDLRLDARFAQSPLVTGEPSLCFYAGVPLVAPDGAVVGTLFVMDTTPRQLREVPLDVLGFLAKQTVTLLEARALRRQQAATSALDERPDYAPSHMAGTVQDITEQMRTTRQIESFFELSVDWLCIAGMDGYYKKVNAACLRSLGYSEAELLSRPLLEFVHEDDRAKTQAEMEKLAVGESTVDFQNRIRAKDGSYRLIDWTVLPVIDEGALYAVGRDVTHQKAWERALRESEERFARLFTYAAAGITLSYPHGNFIQVNPAFAEMVGYDEDELRTLDYLAITHPDDRAENAKKLQQLLQGDFDSFVMEKRYVTKRGDIVWGRASISCIYSEFDEPLYVIGVTENITERVNAEHTAIGLREQLAATLENMTDAFCVLDREWRLTYLNKEAERLILHTTEEVRNVKLWDRFPPTARSELYSQFLRAVQENQPAHFELFYEPLNNWFEVHAYPFPEGLAVYFRVITERKQVLEELRASEERFKIVARATNDAVWDWNLITDEVWWNEGYRTLFGYSHRDYPRDSRSWTKNIHPDDYEWVSQSIQALIENGGENWIAEYRFVRQNGEVAHVLDRAFLIHNAEGRPIRMVGSMVDLTERKKAEQTLRESAEQLRASEHQYRMLFANNPHPMWVFDVETLRFLAVNQRAVEHYGYSEEEFLAMTVRDIRPASELPRLEQRLANLGDYRDNALWRHLKKDGTLIDVEVSSDAIVFDGRDARLVLGNDVTARLHAEEQVRRQAALLDKAQDAIFVHDLEHRVQYWNHGAERLYGWGVEEVNGRAVTELLYRNKESFDQALQQVMNHGEWFGELEQIDRSGREILVEARLTLVRDEEGAPQTILAINTDVTERKKLETQFLRAQRMESIGTLAGGIAHDLNNVLAPILLSLGMLKRQSKTPIEQKLLATLESSAQRGADMVRQVLSFARGVEGERVVVDVGAVVRDLELLIRDTFDRSINFTLVVADDLLPVLGDPTQIHQVVLNLCVNARDAMPQGGDLEVTVSMTVIDSPFASMDLVAEPGPYVLLRVSDTGLGIPAAIHDRIFDPFFTTKEVGKGTGLGLPTVQAVVKSHGGFINVYSEEGRGTEFSIYLPALRNKANDNFLVQSDLMQHSDGELVLVIDDEPAIRLITQQTLESFGYRVLVAEGGAEAIATYLQYQDDISVVLTDMMMPGMDGIAIVSALRKVNPSVAVIAASGLADNSTVARANEAGVRYFLQKPYTMEALLKTLAEIREERDRQY